MAGAVLRADARDKVGGKVTLVLFPPNKTFAVPHANEHTVVGKVSRMLRPSLKMKRGRTYYRHRVPAFSVQLRQVVGNLRKRAGVSAHSYCGHLRAENETS